MYAEVKILEPNNVGSSRPKGLNRVPLSSKVTYAWKKWTIYFENNYYSGTVKVNNGFLSKIWLGAGYNRLELLLSRLLHSFCHLLCPCLATCIVNSLIMYKISETSVVFILVLGHSMLFVNDMTLYN